MNQSRFKEDRVANMIIRLAEERDGEQLIRMRWDFTIEDQESLLVKDFAYEVFEKECKSFLEEALLNKKWYIWVAEKGGEIISHIYIELIDKVPRPGRITYPFAYMTNVYTKPSFRNEGVGSQLLQEVNAWAKENKYEFIIVWPSEDSVNYYRRNGYEPTKEPMEYFPN